MEYFRFFAFSLRFLLREIIAIFPGLANESLRCSCCSRCTSSRSCSIFVKPCVPLRFLIAARSAAVTVANERGFVFVGCLLRMRSPSPATSTRSTPSLSYLQFYLQQQSTYAAHLFILLIPLRVVGGSGTA